MAAGQGFIEFATGDVFTAAAANGYLASQVVMVFASAAARTSGIASPQEGMISYLKDTNSTEYYSGSAWVAIGGGAAGGKILQVVNTTSSTVVTNSTGTYADLISVSITPSATTSRVMIIFNTTFNMAGTDCYTKYKLVYDSSTDLALAELGINSNAYYTTGAISYVHSPSTTSAKTYKIQFAKDSGATTSTSSYGQISITALEIGA